MKTQFGASFFTILTALGLAACSGQIGDDQAAANNGPNGPTGGGTTTMIDPNTGMVVECKNNASFAHARITLIADEQYSNIVRDVFGVAFVGDVSKPPSANGEYNVSETEAVTQTGTAQAYLTAADQVASKIKPCGAAAVTAACMQTYLQDKLPLAWRRPVTPAEMTGLMTVFNLGLPDGTDRAVQITMEAALGSSAFLYRSELGDRATAVVGNTTLDPYEVASAVSFALLNSAPDAQLWAKAQDGSITQQAVLAAEAERIMALPAARANLQKKVSYYLNFEKMPIVTKDAAVFPQFNGLKDSLYQSAQKFLTDILWQGKFNDLFTSRRVYANKDMATAYGIPGVTSTTLVPVDTTGDAYNAGVLTQPALLATSNIHTGTDDIVHRGLWVYNNMACGITIGDPPANATSVFATLMGTEREKALQRDALSCGACHGAFDPFGLVTQSYDPIGRYRTTDPEKGGPIDDSANIVRLGTDINGPVKDVSEVGQKFMAGRRASDCAATKLAKFTLDHNPDVENSCLIQQVKDNFKTSGSFTDLFKAIVTSPAFLTRDLVSAK